MTVLKRWITLGIAAAAALLGIAAQAATITYYHNDLAGSPVVATNAAGQVIWRESYRPYGERTVNSAAALDNKVWFTSRRQDPETGLVYMGARYYDPVVGRFVSMDPVGFDEKNLHTFNRYAYANNNPYRYTDPDGADAVEAIKGWWENSKAGFRSEGPGDALMRAVSALPAEAGVLGAMGAIKAVSSEAKVAAKALDEARRLAADANKLHHIFGKAEHKLGDVVAHFGSPEKAFEAIKSATDASVKADQLTGIFETAVQVGGANVTVRGAVVDGVVKIGTAYIP
jgi:RHS repeat-associated protein